MQIGLSSVFFSIFFPKKHETYHAQKKKNQLIYEASPRIWQLLLQVSKLCFKILEHFPILSQPFIGDLGNSIFAWAADSKCQLRLIPS